MFIRYLTSASSIRYLILFIAVALTASTTAIRADAKPEDGLTTAFVQSLSPQERDWLAAHREIRVGIDPSWEPFEFLDTKGRYRGMAAEYVAVLNVMLGVRMAPVPGLTWAGVMDEAKQGTIDVLPCVVPTSQRKEFLSFTRSYLNFPMVVLTRENTSNIGGLDDLAGKTIGVVKGYATVDLLEKHHPGLRRMEYETLDTGLEALSLGRIDAFVDNLASIANVIKKRGFTNLKVAAQTPYSFELALGVRKDWPELVGILDKALAAISPQTADEIQKNWIAITFEYEVDYQDVAEIIGGLAAVALVVFVVIFYWNRRLMAEVRQRRYFEDILAHRNQIHESIAAGSDLQHVLTTLVTNVESEQPGSLCAVVLIDPHSGRSTETVAPNLPVDYRAREQEGRVEERLQCFSEAIQRRCRVVVPDIRQDSHWSAQKSWLQPLGVTACWVEPIKSSDDLIVGGFVVYRQVAGVPDNLASRRLSEMALLSALAIEHHRNIQTLHKLSLAVEHSPNGVMVTDAAGVIEYVNPKFHEITGYSDDEVVGKTPKVLNSGDTLDETYQELWQTIQEGRDWWGELSNRRKNGEVYWSREHIAPIQNSHGEVSHFVAIIEDVTESHLINEKVSYQASHDALTDLINRRQFEKMLEECVAQKPSQDAHHALCFLDLDQFKVVNDTAGHVAGDELLRQLARLLKSHLRSGDVLARLGGDEFAVLMENCRSEQALRKAEEIRKLIEGYRFPWDDNIFAVGVSIGITEINQLTFSSLDVLKQADIACYAAKEAGRNRVHIFKDDDKLLKERSGEMHSVNRIKKALEEDRFALYVQPIKAVGEALEGAGYEILLRMVEDNGDLLPPGAFLPAAERFNLISQVDHWVVDHAFSWMCEHPRELAGISGFSINLSGQSLGDDSLLGSIIRQLKSGIIPAEKIKFEITETAAIANLSNANVFIAALKEFGVQFALDDFGSGLSSFGYLKNLQVDYLKIDGMFVKDMLDDPIDRAMVKSINDIGHVMNMATIAEFVENDEILRLLTEMEVDYVQGYGIGKPVPIDSLLETGSLETLVAAVSV